MRWLSAFAGIVLGLLLIGQSLPDRAVIKGASAGPSVMFPGPGLGSSGCTLTYTTNLAVKLVSDVGVTQSAGTVSAWADQSGNARDFSEATNMPSYNASGLNGLPTIGFTSTKFLASTIFDQPQPWTMFGVYRNDSTTGGADAFFEGTQAVSSGMVARGANFTLINESAGDGPSVAATTGTWYIVKGKANGASPNSGISINAGADNTGGANMGTTPLTSGGTNRVRLGKNPFRNSGAFTMAAWLLYNEATSGTSTSGNQLLAINYLNCKYAVF